MTNTNCLSAMKCPGCGNTGPFKIECTATFLMYDNGTDRFENVTYDGESYCLCPICDYDGQLREFKTEAAP